MNFMGGSKADFPIVQGVSAHECLRLSGLSSHSCRKHILLQLRHSFHPNRPGSGPNDTLLNDTWGKEQISGKSLKCFELNENENTTYQNLYLP